jgi:hypothetical protein
MLAMEPSGATQFTAAGTEDRGFLREEKEALRLLGRGLPGRASSSSLVEPESVRDREGAVEEEECGDST